MFWNKFNEGASQIAHHGCSLQVADELHPDSVVPELDDGGKNLLLRSSGVSLTDPDQGLKTNLLTLIRPSLKKD
jgi:hypothetical protein